MDWTSWGNKTVSVLGIPSEKTHILFFIITCTDLKAYDDQKKQRLSLAGNGPIAHSKVQ